ncbi:phosphate ABC transporter substrate-binding/OmpA family protein [Rheinheimera sp.]|uniref:phosphate ABC transporter substrate-binding/OmpA family protein n=3 Tax=Rheinheimera sp. TaxID=1869214 RepID=UPI004047FFE1
MSSHTELSAALGALAQLCQTRFQIALSLPQLITNTEYLDSVLAELATVDDAPLQTLLAEIRQLRVAPTVQAAADVKTTVIAEKKPALKLAVVSVALAGLLGAALWYFSAVVSEATPIVVAQPNSAASTATPVAPEQSQETAAVIPAAAPQLRIHGSNTVGEKLAPVLIEAFLAQQGATAFNWQQQNAEVERLLSFTAGSQHQQVQLHAHGSSTAFKDLLGNKADIGMSSRRVTVDEVSKAKLNLGDLSKIGNEHIIALDGLAIIVNQNNPLKAISTEMLARVFSGEISRWSELGGPELPIVLLARDDNSGTFDTFNSLVLKKYAKQLSAKAQRFESSTDLSVAVSQHEAAIGFIGLNYISYNKALAISEGAATTPIYPTRFTVSTEDYALSRRLYLYTPTSASQLAKDFAQFAISEQGQALVEQTGLISQNIRIEKVFPTDGAPASYNQYAQSGQRLSLNFRFNYGENDLDNKGKRDLERLIRFMEQNSGRRLVLMGFSDSVGAVAKNGELAMRRAKAVERELVSRGIPVVAVESYGELLPVANNDTDAGRERNRRVEVWVI